MFCGDYYGKDEVKIMFFRLSLASKELKEKIRQYIIDGQYEIDEKDFLKLLDMTDVDAAFEYYAYLDTAAREYFFMILDKFDKELTSNMLARVLNISELMFLNTACKDEINNLKEVRNKVENFDSIIKPIDSKIKGYETLVEIFDVTIPLKNM